MQLSVALQTLSSTDVKVLAGGTDFYPASGEHPAPENILDITRITELRYIDSHADGWTIGAATTWSDIVNADLPAAFEGLQSAAREVGSIQIQNAATIAGNLCNASPAADGVPPLLSLNASVELKSIYGTRRIPLDEFIVGPRNTLLSHDELMTAIHIPAISSTARSGFYKLGSRRYLVISIVMVCVVLEVDDYHRLSTVGISVGACSAVAQRLSELEQRLLGQSIHNDLISIVTPELFLGLAPIDDVRASGHYRSQSAFELVRRVLSSTLRSLPDYAKPNSPMKSGGST